MLGLGSECRRGTDCRQVDRVPEVLARLRTTVRPAQGGSERGPRLGVLELRTKLAQGEGGR